MNPHVVALAAHCTLATGVVDLSREDGVWVEQITLTVTGDQRCDEVVLPLPPEATATPGSARVLLWDDTLLRLDEHRWSYRDRDQHGAGALVLAIPELGEGDRLKLTAERRVRTDAPWRWRPEGARFAQVRTTAGSLSSLGEGVELDRNRGEAWVQDATVEHELRVLTSIPNVDRLSDVGDALPGGLTTEAALSRVGTLVLVDVGPHVPFEGQPASEWTGLLQERGWLTPQEWALWLRMATRDGPTPLQAAGWLPEAAPPGDVHAFTAPLVVSGAQAFAPPGTQMGAGRVALADGSSSEAAVQVRTGAIAPVVTPHLSRSLTLNLPPGDVQRTLFDGKDAATDVVDVWTLPGSGVRSWVATLPPDTTAVQVTAPDTVRVFQRDDHLRFVTSAQSQLVEVRVDWTRPGVPTFGEPPRIDGATTDLSVTAPSGEVVQDLHGTWWLRQAHDQLVIPDRETLLYSLEKRFGYLSMPEPGLPLEFKFRDATLAGLRDLPQALYTRALPEDIPHPTLWPRPIKKARGTGAVSGVEAMLIVTRYAQQLRAGAEWVLVRPASMGPGGRVSPSGYTDGLLYVWNQEGGLWLDPGCRWCAPGELRPGLTGASALSWSFTETPAPQPGTLIVTRTGDAIQLSAEGPAALEIRQWASKIPAADRDGALGSWLGGEGAALQQVEGLAEPGAKLSLGAAGDREGLDPLALPAADADGTTWVDWTGHRRWVGAKVPPMPMDVRLDNGVRYRRTVSDDGTITEDLWVWRRRIPADVRLRLEVLRRPAPRPL